MNRPAAKLTSILGMTLVVTLLAAEPADARRGGSFGSRGMRTYQAPPRTQTAPQATAPVQRTMTAAPKTAAQNPSAAAPAAAQAPRRGGFLGGMGGGLLGGLVAGGLIGMMLGNGFGGLGAGLGAALMQLAIVGLGVWLLMALFRRRRAQPAMAGAGMDRPFAFAGAPPASNVSTFETPVGRDFGGSSPDAPVEIGLMQSDRDAFERMLTEVQDAFGREDYAALRALTTPEIMSYLSEELSRNATQNRRNEVSGTRLLEADVAEAWREGDTDYATAALRYEGVDVMRDRQTGAIVAGDPERPTETTELWTFVRSSGGAWKLSAIQEA